MMICNSNSILCGKNMLIFILNIFMNVGHTKLILMDMGIEDFPPTAQNLTHYC